METEYKTSDINIASILIVKGSEYIRTEATNGIKKQVIFVLNTGNIDTEKIIQEYNDDTLLVEVKSFIDTFKALKKLVYNKLNNY